MSKTSHYVSFLTNRRRRKSQTSSTDSVSAVGRPLLEKPPTMNTTVFPAMPTPPNSPPSSRPSSKVVPSSPSLRKRVLGNIGCSCSREALDEESYDSPRPASKEFTINSRDSPYPRPRSITAIEGSQPFASRSSMSMDSSSHRTSSVADGVRITFRDTPPPTLTLPDATLNTGLGWGDEFGIKIRPPRPWASNRTISQSSKQTTWSQPSRPPTPQVKPHSEPTPRPRDLVLSYSPSPLAMPTPRTVLEGAGAGLGLDCGGSDTSSFYTPEEERHTKRKDVLTVRFLEHLDDVDPPRLGLDLPQSGDSDEWAAAVLKAVGTSKTASS
ncbi:hypothetical protein M422DRAFT_44875 [Sphaerobolus stellatus SS14]|nr:hypothetical protein M422DRAFT_44875 [Sphaerobolus stellatus SS14]